jgi:hypothetical protein
MNATRQSTSSRIIGWGSIVVGVLSFAIGAGPAALIPLMLGLLIATGAFAAPFVLFYYWRRRDLLEQPTTFRAGPNGIHYQAPYGRSELTWGTFNRIRETGRFIYLETGLNVLYVPKRALDPAQMTEFRRLIAEAGFGPDGRRAAGAQPSAPPR